MNILEAENKAIYLMQQYGLAEWHFTWDNAVERFGSCSEEEKTISLSKNLVELNQEKDVLNTIRHEIAHALTPGCGHNEIWKRVARALDCTGERCYNDLVIVPVHKYKAVCPTCGHTINRNNKRRNLYCTNCVNKNGRKSFRKEYKFKWYNQKPPVKIV